MVGVMIFEKDYKDVANEPQMHKILLKRMAVMEIESRVRKVPFCMSCAQNAIKDAIVARKLKLERETGATVEEHKDYLKIVDTLNLEEFFGDVCFTRGKESKQTATKTLPSGQKELYTEGYWIEYVCKNNPQHKNSIFYEVKEFENMKK